MSDVSLRRVSHGRRLFEGHAGRIRLRSGGGREDSKKKKKKKTVKGVGREGRTRVEVGNETSVSREKTEGLHYPVEVTGFASSTGPVGENGEVYVRQGPGSRRRKNHSTFGQERGYGIGLHPDRSGKVGDRTDVVPYEDLARGRTKVGSHGKGVGVEQRPWDTRTRDRKVRRRDDRRVSRVSRNSSRYVGQGETG